MLLEGHVENGQIILDEPTSLPEGAKVRVEVVLAAPPEGKGAPSQGLVKTLAERYAAALGIAPDLPADMASRHDHYIHGSSR